MANVACERVSEQARRTLEVGEEKRIRDFNPFFHLHFSSSP